MLKKIAIPLFFVLAVLISWIPWYTGGSGFLPIGVSVAGLIIIIFTEGKDGLKDTARRILRWRVSLRWYGAALFLMAGISLVSLGIHWLAGGKLPGFGFLFEDTRYIPQFLLFVIFHPMAGPIGEETVGWRGYALPRLQEKVGPIFATLIIGAIYGAWHLPEFFNPGSSQYAIGFAFFIPFILKLITSSFFMTWVFNKSGGSTLVGGILFHAANNFWLAVLTSGFRWGAPHPPFDSRLYWILTIVSVAAAGVLLAVTKGKLGYVSEEVKSKIQI
ncbi:MAG: CAAX amino terminal protease self- immunity [Firmicutes bacterium ADurb.Bin182]|nr:MAG: CAAX amino terminal protease self- immunity [Firmicutes bacterium ADurb.Bin182]